MRIFLAFLVAAFALGAAIYLNQYQLHRFHAYPGPSGLVIQKYSWQDPLAILVAVAGVGAGIAVALSARSSR